LDSACRLSRVRAFAAIFPARFSVFSACFSSRSSFFSAFPAFAFFASLASFLVSAAELRIAAISWSLSSRAYQMSIVPIGANPAIASR
jgi:hypothetical protein